MLALVDAGIPLAGTVWLCRWEVERVFTWCSTRAILVGERYSRLLDPMATSVLTVSTQLDKTFCDTA